MHGNCGCRENSRHHRITTQISEAELRIDYSEIGAHEVAKFVKTTLKIPANTSIPTQSRPSTFPKKGPVQINLNPKFEEDPELGVGERFGINNIQSGLLTGVLGKIFFCLFLLNNVSFFTGKQVLIHILLLKFEVVLVSCIQFRLQVAAEPNVIQ